MAGRMAGLRRGPKANSVRSLGSFVDVPSASSSDFEPVDLEDMESTDEGDNNISQAKPRTPCWNFLSSSAVRLSSIGMIMA